MPWQRGTADVGCEFWAETRLPVYRRVFVTVPRQQGKTTLFTSWQVHRCTHPRWAQPQRSVFTAQSGKDARDKWLDEIFPLLRSSKALKPLIRRINEGMGNESVRFVNGSLIRLLSTSSSSGHSKTLHQAVLDEIWHDSDFRREQGLGPAMLTVQDAQQLSCSTAGTDASVVYEQAVKAGIAAVEADADSGFCFVCYQAPDGWDPDDEESYFSFMPALCPDPPCRCGGGRWRHTVTLDVIRGERDSMEPDEFRRAYGNIPDRSGAKADKKIPPAAWAACADSSSDPAGPVALACVFSNDRSRAAIGLAGGRADGRWHVEVADYRAGTNWVVPWLMSRAERLNPCAVVVDPGGHEGSVIADLEAAGVEVTKPSARDVAAAYGVFHDAVTDSGILRHRDQGDLNRALGGATTRDIGDAGTAWGRKRSGADISPLVAATLALWGWHLNAGGDYDTADSVHFDVDEVARLYRMGVYGPADLERLKAAGLPVPAGL
jgi:hypothetical protein